jgi:hypothetical protein
VSFKMLSKSSLDILMGLLTPDFFSMTLKLINKDANTISAAFESLLKCYCIKILEEAR